MGELTEDQRERLEMLIAGDARTLGSGNGKVITPSRCRELRRLWLQNKERRRNAMLGTKPPRLTQAALAEIVGVPRESIGYHLRGECRHWDGDMEALLERERLESAPTRKTTVIRRCKEALERGGRANNNEDKEGNYCNDIEKWKQSG